MGRSSDFLIDLTMRFRDHMRFQNLLLVIHKFWTGDYHWGFFTWIRILDRPCFFNANLKWLNLLESFTGIVVSPAFCWFYPHYDPANCRYGWSLGRCRTCVLTEARSGNFLFLRQQTPFFVGKDSDEFPARNLIIQIQISRADCISGILTCLVVPSFESLKTLLMTDGKVNYRRFPDSQPIW